MSIEVDRIKARRTVHQAQITRFVKKAQSTLGTEPIDVMKLHAFFKLLVLGNAELSSIKEQLDESFTYE